MFLGSNWQIIEVEDFVFLWDRMFILLDLSGNKENEEVAISVKDELKLCDL